MPALPPMQECNSGIVRGTFCWTGSPVLLIIRHPASLARIVGHAPQDLDFVAACGSASLPVGRFSAGRCVGRCVGDVGAWAEALPNSFRTSGALRGAAVSVGRTPVTDPFPFAPGRGRRDQACAFRQAWRRLDNRQLVSRSRAAHLRGFRRRLPFPIHRSSTKKEGTKSRRAVWSYSRRDAGEDHNTGHAFS
jgi:hypothetical protein